MYRPNGIAVVTTGLGAVVLLHVIWSWGRHPEPRPEQSSQPPGAMSDAGAVLQFHSGAWRPQPGRAEAEPATTPAVASVTLPPAVDMSAPATVVSTAVHLPASAAAAPTTAVRSVPVQQITPRGGPSALPPESEASAETATAVEPLANAAVTSPAAPPEGRMALAGPDVEAAPPPPSHHAVRSATAARASPRAAAPAATQEADAPAPAPIESKFGPGNFKQFDRNGY